MVTDEKKRQHKTKTDSFFPVKSRMENAKYVRIYKSSDFYNIQHLLNQDEKTLFVQLYISCISLVAVLQELTHLQEIAGHFRNIICSVSLYCGAGQSSRYSDWLRAGRSGDRIPVGARFFRTCPDRPWGPPSLLYNGYRVFPGGKERLGRDADPSPPSSAVFVEG